MLKTSDVQLLDNSLDNLGDTLLKNRMMKAQAAAEAQKRRDAILENRLDRNQRATAADELNQYRTATDADRSRA